MKILSIGISVAQKGICASGQLSIPTRRQMTNEVHLIERSYSTKSIIKALWLFRRDAKRFAKEKAAIEGPYDLSPSNFRRGLFWT